MRSEEISDDTLGLLEERQENTEVAPGVFVERRFFLRASALAAAALLLPSPKAVGAAIPRQASGDPSQRTAATASITTGPLSWEQFLSETVPLAQQILKESGPDLDYYLYRVASVAVRLRAAPETKLYPLGVAPNISLAPSYKGPPFVAIQWRMGAGAVFPPHNHPNYSVCTVGLEGEARIRNYEVLGDAPEFSSKKSFRVRQTHDEIIAAGRINTLSPTRDNIHRFEAGKRGARGIDITTLHGAELGFSFIEMEERAVDAEQRIYEAAWKNFGR
jgi:hypothetical protein